MNIIAYITLILYVGFGILFGLATYYSFANKRKVALMALLCGLLWPLIFLFWLSLSVIRHFKNYGKD